MIKCTRRRLSRKSIQEKFIDGRYEREDILILDDKIVRKFYSDYGDIDVKLPILEMITHFDFDGNILDNEYFSKSDDNQVNKIKK